jgi:NAD(P)-dependent dehydrogenase (short-subunit alcohol dehydrogenase family)
LADLAADAWADIIATNLTGTANLLSAALPLLVERGGGDIVVVSSVAALQGRTRIAAYSASKAGVLGLVSSVTADYAQAGVRINAVCPGPTETPMTRGLSNRAPSNGPGRAATADEIASVIDWLLSPASAWINGAVLPVDAGETAAFAWAFRRSTCS